MKETTLALVPLSRMARKALRYRPYAELDALPFRVGRESRLTCRWGRYTGMETRNDGTLPNNDLYLLTNPKSPIVSREHFQIERREDGKFELVDRGSMLGTTVRQQHVGGEHAGGRVEIRDGDRICLGSPDLRCSFEFTSVVAPLRARARQRQAMRQVGRFALLVIAPVAVSVWAIASTLAA
jgi:hypothetical protein